MFTKRHLTIAGAAIVAGVVGTTGVVAVTADTDTADRTERSHRSAVEEAPADAPSSETLGTVAADVGSTAVGSHESATPPSSNGEPGSDVALPTDVLDPIAGGSSDPAIGADPEAPLPGPAGVISGDAAATDPPPPNPLPAPSGLTELASVPQPPPPAPSVPGPVDLVTPPMDPGPPPIDDLATPIDPTPIDGPTDLRDTPLPDFAGSFSSDFSGCQLRCVTSALLTSSPTSPDLRLDATMTVPVSLEVEVADVDGGWTEVFSNGGYDTEWSTILGPLAPDTTYDLTLLARDEDGHIERHEHRFTTMDVAGGLTTGDVGCRLECITVGTVTPGEEGNEAEVRVATHSAAALTVWLSTSEPTWVHDDEAKPAGAPVFQDASPSTSWTVRLDDLAYDTRYHVVARAEDAHGAHIRVGSFRTGVDPRVDVLVRFEQMVITHDGDAGAHNRGEITLSWGFDGQGIGSRSEQKMHARTVTLDANNAQWFRIDPATGSIPNPTSAAHERDGDGVWEYCSEGVGPGSEPRYHDDCDRKTNVAHHGGPISLEQILDFPSCQDLGVPSGIGARCATLSSAVVGTRDDDYAHFSAIVSFFVVE